MGIAGNDATLQLHKLEQMYHFQCLAQFSVNVKSSPLKKRIRTQKSIHNLQEH